MKTGEGLLMQIVCSQCGVQKREVNRWFAIWRERFEMRLCIMPLELDPAMSREETVQKVCGDQCLHKTVQQFSDFLRIAA